MIILSYIVLFLLFLFLLFYILTYLMGGWYAPLSQKKVDEMLNLAKISKRDFLIDLGSGDGRIIISSGKIGARALGYEINPFLYYLSILRIKLNNLDSNTRIEYSNFWYQDLSKATIITIFLAPLSIKRLEKKLLKELKPGTRVVTYGLGFPNWKITKQTKDGMFLYTKN